MENKQKRDLFSLIYRILSFVGIVVLLVAITLSIFTILGEIKSQFVWLDWTLVSISVLLFVFIFADTYKTKRLKHKYSMAKLYIYFFVLNLLAMVALGAYIYVEKIALELLVSNLITLALVMFGHFIYIINFMIGLQLSKLYKSTTVNIDATVEVPNFDDEIALRKKLEELNRKLEMKKIQEEIAKKEEQLDS